MKFVNFFLMLLLISCNPIPLEHLGKQYEAAFCSDSERDPIYIDVKSGTVAQSDVASVSSTFLGDEFVLFFSSLPLIFPKQSTLHGDYSIPIGEGRFSISYDDVGEDSSSLLLLSEFSEDFSIWSSGPIKYYFDDSLGLTAFTVFDHEGVASKNYKHCAGSVPKFSSISDD